MLMRALLVAFGLSVVAADQWAVTNAANKTCVLIDFKTIDVKLNLETDYNKTVEFNFVINKTESVTGKCLDTHGEKKDPANFVEAHFFPNGIVPKSAVDAQPWSISMWFGPGTGTVGEKSSPPQRVSTVQILRSNEVPAFHLVDYVLETGPYSALNVSSSQTFNKSSTAERDVQAQSNHAYKCSTTGLALTSEGTITFKDVRVVAQALLDNATFPENQAYDLCLLDTRTSDVVPIVVGACLAGLVLVVLVAYLIGRARARRQGYASV